MGEAGRRLTGALAPALMLGPIAAGALATILPAFGYMPALGGKAFSLAPWLVLAGTPGLAWSVVITIGDGVAATLLACVSAVALAVLARHVAVLRIAQAAIAPALAIPYAALAIGVLFVLAPSGWIARLISPWLTGWTVPPDLATVQDAYGVAVTVALWLKETPFLLLMTLAALAQADVPASRRVAASLGYGPWRAWLLVVLPRVWPQVRLPVMAVLAFSLSVVDVALILGPSDPPTLAVQTLNFLTDPDLAAWFPGCAAAVLLTAIVGASLAAMVAVERGAAWIGRRLVRGGTRGGNGGMLDVMAGAVGGVQVAGSGAAMIAIALWAFAATWRFPAALPQSWSGAGWHEAVLRPALTTLAIGAIATAAALAVCIAALESGRFRAARVIYLPLLVPQTTFLFGWQIVLTRLRLDGTLPGVVWTHLVFVLPYVFLGLSDPWRALDPRFARTAACLGAPPWRVLVRVKLPLLLRPLLAAAAVGFAVSAALYLPTLFAGAGRIDTLTTEAVTLASGGDRRVLAQTALLQAALPLLVFAAAVAVPGWRERRRPGTAPAA